MKRRKNSKISKEQFETLINVLHETEQSFSGIQEISNDKTITEEELLEILRNSDDLLGGTVFNEKCAKHLFYHFVNAVNFNSKGSYNLICKYVRQKRAQFIRAHFPTAISYEKKNFDEDSLNDLMTDIDNFISKASGVNDVYSSDLCIRLINPSLLHVVETVSQKSDPNFRYIFLQMLSSPLESFTDKHLSVGNGYDLNTFFELTVFYLKFFSITNKDENMDSALLKECLPPQLAFLIGQAYLNGEFLPLNKDLAFRWFAYGAFLGDTKCLMAFLLHFSNLDCSDEQKLALVFVREVGAIDNITYRQLSGVKSVRASKDLSRMVNYCLLEAKKHSNQTYYVVGEELKAKIKKLNPPTSEPNPPSLDVNPPT